LHFALHVVLAITSATRGSEDAPHKVDRDFDEITIVCHGDIIIDDDKRSILNRVEKFNPARFHSINLRVRVSLGLLKNASPN
jgi:hypothetical protein